MAKDPYQSYDSYEDEYEESDEGKKPMTIFLVALGVLLLALVVVCVLLTMKLRTANTEIATLNTQLTAAQADAANEQWNYTPAPDSAATPAPDAAATPAPTDVPAATATPEPTPSPTPVPTATPAPLVTEPGGLPSWLTEANMAGLHKRPADDEWYATPGKLYVTAEMGLNMRTGPDSSYALRVTIPTGTEVTVYAAHDNWRFVQDQRGNFGWVSNNLLSTTPPAGAATPTPASSPTPTPVAPATPSAEPPKTSDET